MNGVHDMGGLQDMGPMRVEKNEPVFHAEWEGRVFALYQAVDGDWPGGSGRYQRELIPPAEYLRMIEWVLDLPGQAKRAAVHDSDALRCAFHLADLV